jgi:predicted DNA-binding protein (MmcQ/YjbR family)
MTDYADVSPEVVARLRAICLALPEAWQDAPWTGARWRIRQRTFAHVLAVDSPAGPDTLLLFRSAPPELDVLVRSGHPFFRPGAPAGAVGMVIDAGVDWAEVQELVTDSYCLLAPKKLAARVDRPEPDGD